MRACYGNGEATTELMKSNETIFQRAVLFFFRVKEGAWEE